MGKLEKKIVAAVNSAITEGCHTVRVHFAGSNAEDICLAYRTESLKEAIEAGLPLFFNGFGKTPAASWLDVDRAKHLIGHQPEPKEIVMITHGQTLYYKRDPVDLVSENTTGDAQGASNTFPSAAPVDMAAYGSRLRTTGSAHRCKMMLISPNKLISRLISVGYDVPVMFTLEKSEAAPSWAPWYELELIRFRKSPFGMVRMTCKSGSSGTWLEELPDAEPETVSGIVSGWLMQEARNFLATENVIVVLTPEELWAEFGDVPTDPTTECIESDWLHFPMGTHREEIWHWFEDYFGTPVHSLMFPDTASYPWPEMETPFPEQMFAGTRYPEAFRQAVAYGYNPGKWVLPLSAKEAQAAWDGNLIEVVALYPDNTESVLSDDEEFTRHVEDGGMFGVDLADVIALYYESLQPDEGKK